MFELKKHQLNFTRREGSRDGNIKVTIIQEAYPERVIGRRVGQGIYVGRNNASQDREELREQVRGLLARIPETADIGVLSEHPGNQLSIDLYQEQADGRQQIIIARLGHYRHKPGDKTSNTVAVFAPGHDPVMVKQITFSEEDLKYHAQGKLQRGQEVHIFSTPLGNMGIISCHDYTNADILKKIVENDIEILIVSAFNPATRLFIQYALADIHRFSCFVIISNIANYGGSGVFAPFRYNGPKRAAISLGGAVAYTQGETSAFLEVDLPIAELRNLRHKDGNTQLDKRCPWTPIQPSEEFLSAGQPDYKQKLDASDYLHNIDLEELMYLPNDNQGKFNIGIAQLKCMDEEDYLNNYYCVSCSPNAPRFIKGVQKQLEFLASNLELTGQKLDFLLFPEVFLPLEMDSDLKEFARKFNTIILSGVEYDAQPETLDDPQMAHGSNRCFIYTPTRNGEVKRFQYNKMTRSQYDARIPATADGEPGNFTMDKGSQLLRFSYGKHWAFGVLICYDYSHFDIIHKINRPQTNKMPLDMLFIVASNPDSQLYERCCIADSHRYYQYIIMCNVAQFGGSGIYGPVKTPGLRQTLLSAGLGTEGIFIGTVDIANLQKARKAEYMAVESNYQHKPGIFQMIDFIK
ncbi:MAG: hypothetical protein PHX14_12255 [Syntrophomonadaceae bacterium]|nr:hypothetical protein [Syntrophomonadaceae bacterium]